MNPKVEDFRQFREKCIPNYAKIIDKDAEFYEFYSNESKINCLMELAKHMTLLMDDLDKAHPPKLMVVPAPNNTPSVIICEYIQIDDHMIVRPYHLSLFVASFPGTGDYISYSYIDTIQYFMDTSINELSSVPNNIVKQMFIDIILDK